MNNTQRQNATLSSALTKVNNAVTGIKNANNNVNRSATNFANNRPTAANNSANKAASQFGNGYNQLMAASAKMENLARQSNGTAANNANRAAAYFKRAAGSAAKALVARSLVDIGMGVNAIARGMNSGANVSK